MFFGILSKIKLAFDNSFLWFFFVKMEQYLLEGDGYFIITEKKFDCSWWVWDSGVDSWINNQLSVAGRGTTQKKYSGKIIGISSN